MLVYSGLMRARADGTFVPDLADHYSISTDGTTYTFTIRPDATFHDGTPVTAADVLYTVSQAQNPDTKSPRRADWEGVQVSSPDEHTVVFTLPHAYAPFMENATLGILPAHLWRDVPAGQFAFSTYNTHPIGSGPYRVANTQTDATGAATRFELVPFERFTLGSPHLAHINFSFFTSDEALVRALVNGQIDAIAGITPSYLVNLPKTVSLVRSPLPRVFGVFLNETKNPVLADASVRAALAAAIDKPALVKNVLSGFGVPISGPIPPGVVGFAKALELAHAEREQESLRLTELRDYLVEGLMKIPKSRLNGHPTDRLPNSVNVSFLDIEGEAAVLYLDAEGIMASTGSACASSSLDPSHVILATGLSYEAAHGSIRFTLGRKTTKEELDHVIRVMPGIIERLRKMSPVNLDMKYFE
jgi:ABC-type oligopeptide transport system substrate-binding subunit